MQILTQTKSSRQHRIHRFGRAQVEKKKEKSENRNSTNLENCDPPVSSKCNTKTLSAENRLPNEMEGWKSEGLKTAYARLVFGKATVLPKDERQNCYTDLSESK